MYGLNGYTPRSFLTESGLRKLAFSLGSVGWRSTWWGLRRMAGLHRRTLARQVRVVAVVGSAGKTTTAKVAGAVLGVSTLTGVLQTAFRLPLALLSIRPRQRYGVVEVGEPEYMEKNAQIVRPDVVIATSIGSDHSRSLGPLDDIRDKKARILGGLRRDGIVLLNGDDERILSFAGLTDARVLTFGFGPSCDVRVTEFALDWPQGTRLRIEAADASAEVRLRLFGRVMAYPVLAALALAWVEGRPWSDVIPVLEGCTSAPGRLQVVPLPNGAWMIRDEFKSSLETIDAALDLLAEVPGRRFVVLGEISDPIGSQGPHYRRIGRRLGEIVSGAIIIAAKNHFRSYATGAASVGLSRDAFVHVRSVYDAIAAIRSVLQPNDVVLIKGRSAQRLDRVALALQGASIGCRIEFCALENVRCGDCPKLTTGTADISRGWLLMQEARGLLKTLPRPWSALETERLLRSNAPSRDSSPQARS